MKNRQELTALVLSVVLAAALPLLIGCQVKAPSQSTTEQQEETVGEQPAQSGPQDNSADPSKRVLTVEEEDGYLDIKEALRAFNKEMPSESVGRLIAKAGEERFYTENSNGEGLGLFIDCEDFQEAYFDLGDAASERMMARVYSRDNGHSLFAMAIERLKPENSQTVYFYDYSPMTKRMTPEEAPYANFGPYKEGIPMVVHSLGFEHDNTIVLRETQRQFGDLYHYFVYNGVRHRFDHSSETDETGANEEGDEEGDDEIVEGVPRQSKKVDEDGDYALYVNEDVAGPENLQYSVWLYDKSAREVIPVVTTNDAAEPRWSQMTEGNGVPVDIVMVAAGDCSMCYLVPWAPGKVFVEGCPDGRNVWSYVIDAKGQTAIQFPSNEGLELMDSEKHVFNLVSYAYRPEGGRYSVVRSYMIDGRFTGAEREAEE